MNCSVISVVFSSYFSVYFVEFLKLYSWVVLYFFILFIYFAFNTTIVKLNFLFIFIIICLSVLILHRYFFRFIPFIFFFVRFLSPLSGSFQVFGFVAKNHRFFVCLLSIVLFLLFCCLLPLFRTIFLLAAHSIVCQPTIVICFPFRSGYHLYAFSFRFNFL